MKMFEKLRVGTTYHYVSDDEMVHAKTVYDRYVDFLKKYYGNGYGFDREHTAMSLTEFLLQDVDYMHLDSFMWDKGVLVKTRSGCLGITVGWAKAGSCSYAVKVRTAGGIGSCCFDDLEKAAIPPEVLEYVKSTLQDKVHDKVDEAFKEG